MAASNKATQKTGVTHFPLEEEKKNQQRIPPRGKSKAQMKTTSQSRKGGTLPALTTGEERAISRLGAKGGKSSGSRGRISIIEQEDSSHVKKPVREPPREDQSPRQEPPPPKPPEREPPTKEPPRNDPPEQQPPLRAQRAL